jgi:hypothetical protein
MHLTMGRRAASNLQILLRQTRRAARRGSFHYLTPSQKGLLDGDYWLHRAAALPRDEALDLRAKPLGPVATSWRAVRDGELLRVLGSAKPARSYAADCPDLSKPES